MKSAPRRLERARGAWVTCMTEDEDNERPDRRNVRSANRGRGGGALPDSSAFERDVYAPKCFRYRSSPTPIFADATDAPRSSRRSATIRSSSTLRSEYR